MSRTTTGTNTEMPNGPRHVLHLVSDLGPTAAGKQVSLLVPALKQLGWQNEVVVLGESYPFADPLRECAIPVQPIRMRYLVDLAMLRQLQRRVSASPASVICIWGVRAAILANFLGDAARRPWVVTHAFSQTSGPSGWLCNRTLRSARKVIAHTLAEMAIARKQSLLPGQTTLIPIAASLPGPVPDSQALREQFDIPANARVIVAAGKFDRKTDLQAAVWAFDILKYPYADLHLVLLGEGPDRSRVERFASSLAVDDHRVHFVGIRNDVARFLDLANIVWNLQPNGAINVVLEALFRQRPVLSVWNPDLVGLVDESRMVPAGDKVALATITNSLLESQEDLRRFPIDTSKLAEKHGVEAVAVPLSRILAGESSDVAGGMISRSASP